MGSGLHPKGDKHYNVKLTDEEVQSILSDKRSQRKIAADFNVSQQYVSELKRGLKRK